jgi:tRNA dimethylallyltransferase
MVPHHFINSLDVTEPYNIGKFEEDALNKTKLLFANHDIVLVSGGSGLYIKALCKGLDVLPESDPDLRKELNNLFETQGIQALQKKLQDADPEYYSEADVQNPHRLIRALEVIILSGKKFSSLRNNKEKARDFMIKKIGLSVDRSELYMRINKRVDEMILNGLAKEVKSLLPYRNENALQTVGYKEIIEYLDNKTSLESAIESIKQNTRNYAKRQMTWFRKDQEIHWFHPEKVDEIIRYVDNNR